MCFSPTADDRSASCVSLRFVCGDPCACMVLQYVFLHIVFSSRCPERPLLGTLYLRVVTICWAGSMHLHA